MLRAGDARHRDFVLLGKVTRLSQDLRDRLLVLGFTPEPQREAYEGFPPQIELCSETLAGKNNLLKSGKDVVEKGRINYMLDIVLHEMVHHYVMINLREEDQRQSSKEKGRGRFCGMLACWVLLAASGEIPASIINVRPPRFVTAERPLVSEVDLSSSEFPVVRFQIGSAPEAETEEPEIQSAIIQLGIVGDHTLMLRALETAALLAPSYGPLLVLGETGTGKELIARFVHSVSGRHRGPFLPVNCAAVPELLVESLLFGHKKGAFTGALSDQVGKFDAADGGTLFLDELGELPQSAQAKLLRVLQDGFVEPVGARPTSGASTGAVRTSEHVHRHPTRL
jgi:sigma54-dependent transcription regulator